MNEAENKNGSVNSCCQNCPMRNCCHLRQRCMMPCGPFPQQDPNCCFGPPNPFLFSPNCCQSYPQDNICGNNNCCMPPSFPPLNQCPPFPNFCQRPYGCDFPFGMFPCAVMFAPFPFCMGGGNYNCCP